MASSRLTCFRLQDNSALILWFSKKIDAKKPGVLGRERAVDFFFRHHSPPQIVRVYFLFACLVLCSRRPYCLRAWQRLALSKI